MARTVSFEAEEANSGPFCTYEENEAAMASYEGIKTGSYYASWKPFDETPQEVTESVTIEKQTQAAQSEREAAGLSKQADETRCELRQVEDQEMRLAAESCCGVSTSMQIQCPPSPQCVVPNAPPAQMACGYQVMPSSLPIMFMPVQPAPMNGLIQMMPLPQQSLVNLVPIATITSHDKDAGQAAGSKTTVMWRNLPNNYSRDELLHLIDSQGFEGCYDFFYSPFDFSSDALVGYAFINFVSTTEADRFFYTFQGFTAWSLKSDKVSEVSWSQLQGLPGHIERYRNSAVMHPEVADDKRPMLFNGGMRVCFPAPTKKLRPPHLKDCRP